MKITRENYEIWFVDWLDSRLSGEEIEELNFFLDNNPDLRDEFTDMSAIKLKPAARSFAGKDRLVRNIAGIPGKQFEILCAARLENDLDSQQLDELNELISSDPEKAVTLQIYSKMKLSPPEIFYKKKERLLRATPAGKVMRIAWIGLSAAAIVAILFMTRVFREQNDGVKPELANNTRVQLPSTDNQESSQLPKESTPVIAEPASTGKRVVGYTKNDSFEKDRKELPEREEVFAPEKIALSDRPQLSGKKDYLMPFTASSIPPENTGIDTDEGRSKVGRFLARHFRSDILEEGSPSDAPLKGYEIAEAGIGGLNKLLGWDMALTKRTDENGEVKSLNFNSRMLKFNTPVKNNSAAE